jgi:hypothetical protein
MITLGTAGMVLGVAAGSRAGAQTAAMTASAAVVPIQGTVSGGAESVRFAGHAQLRANVVPDDHTGGWPTVILTIDLSKVSGVGALTGRKYVTLAQETFTRQLSAADTVEASFPFYPNGDGDIASARVGMAAFHLSYNVNTLKLTGATAEIQGH